MDLKASFGIILFGIIDMIQKHSYSHLTLWTWMYHGMAYGSEYIEDRVIKDVCILTSCIGAMCVLNSYVLVLFMNPTLEYDLFRNANNDSTFAADVHIRIWGRSIILHVLPVLYSYQVMQERKETFKELATQYYYLYLILPLAHMFAGLLYKYNTGKQDFNAFHIYISSNNRFKISEPVFIAATGCIMVSTIFATQYYLRIVLN